MAEKAVTSKIKIQIEAGAATPAPPVGTALGPTGISMQDFCKEYNARTEDQRGSIVPVEITIYEDRTFSFITKTPPTALLIKAAMKMDKASQNPGIDIVGEISDSQIEEIAKVKLPDLNTDDLEAAKQQVAGTARSMGIKTKK